MSTWLIWALRDLMRRPASALMLGMALLLLTTLVASGLFLAQALEDTAREVLQTGPALVVRRVGPTGWSTFPAAEAEKRARAVTGVTSARARVWGLISGPDGPLTVQATDELKVAPKQAVVGPGVLQTGRTELELAGTTVESFEVIQVLEPSSSVAAHDLVLLNKGDAVRMLGLPEGHASDLVVAVFHDAEQRAILPDLAEAFAWPVQITTREQAVGQYATSFSRQSGLQMMILVPMLLALFLIVVAAARVLGRKSEAGLLRTLGWTTKDIARLHLFRSTLIAVPAVALGTAIAAVFVYSPGITWPATLLLGRVDLPPALYLDPSGAGLVVIETLAFVLAPFIVATLIGALIHTSEDPSDLLEESS